MLARSVLKRFYKSLATPSKTREDNTRVLLVPCAFDVYIASRMLIIIATMFCTSYVDIKEIMRDRIQLKQAATYFATFLPFVSLGLLSLWTRRFPIKYCHQKYFVLSFLLGRCLQFPDKSGILRENDFRLSFFIGKKKNCINPHPYLS